MKKNYLMPMLLMCLLLIFITACEPDDVDDDCIMCETTSECVDSLGDGWVCQGGCCTEIDITTTTTTAGETTTTTIDNSEILDEIYDNMVSISSGTFEMGCSAGDSDCYVNESPQHTVSISSFKMSAYEVTQGQWESVMGNKPSYFLSCGDDCPIVGVTWDKVQDFIDELNSKTVNNYRLPTEAEWEYAARAGTTTKYYCGDDESCLDGIAWYDDNSGDQTHPVGQKTPNAWGLYDMSGNVYEWVQDWYDEDYYESSPSTDPEGPLSGTYRGFRGGSWKVIQSCRSSRRSYSRPVQAYDSLGFRLALP